MAKLTDEQQTFLELLADYGEAHGMVDGDPRR